MSWEALGASWQPLGGFLESLGSLLAPLGASWGGLLGTSLGGLWLILAPLERSLAGLGVVLGLLGRKSSLGYSGSTILGAPRGAPGWKNGPGSNGSMFFRVPRKLLLPLNRLQA